MRNRERMEAEELKRQLERLTREQNELRQQAEQLAERMQQQGSRQSSQNGESGGQSGEQGAGGQSDRTPSAARDLRGHAERRDRPQAAGFRHRPRTAAVARPSGCASSNDRCRAHGRTIVGARSVTCNSRPGSWPMRSGASRTKPTEPRTGPLATMRGAVWLVIRSGWPSAPSDSQEHVRQLARTGQGESSERSRRPAKRARDLERQKIGERMRQSAESLRQPAGEQAGGSRPHLIGTRQAARQGEDVARALDRIADRLGAATGAQDSDSRRLSDGLSKTQELRDKVADLERTIEQLQREAKEAQAGKNRAPRTVRDARAQGREQAAERQGPQQAQGGQTPGSSNGQPVGAGTRGRQRPVWRQHGRQRRASATACSAKPTSAREIERLLESSAARTRACKGPNQEESWWRSISAPGTEAFKQDFSRWESLKKNLLVSLEDVESKLSGELRALENKQRFNAGGHETVSEAYRELVDKYHPIARHAAKAR